MHTNEWFDTKTVETFLLHDALNSDCKYYIISFLPINLWSSCDCCGFALMCCNEYGTIFISKEAKYSFSMCTMCYNICQT